MKFKLDKWQRDFNKNVYSGLAGGLFVYFSILFMGEAIRSGFLQDTVIIKIMGTFVISIFLYLIMVLTLMISKKLLKEKL